MNASARKHAQGLSLIELMIALLIGSILMIGVIQVFAASRNAYQLSQGMARVQENGRFAMDFLQRDVRMVGHYGCVNDQARLQTPGLLTSHVTAGDNPLNFAISLQGYEANGTAPGASVNLASPSAGWQPGLPAYLSGLNPKPGSDIIVLRFFYGSGAPITVVGPTQLTVLPANWGALTLDGVGNPALFGVSDCSYADVFQASATNSGAGTVNTTDSGGVRTGIPDFVGHYTATPSGQATLYRAESMVYYVGTRTGSPVSSLYRTRFATNVNGTAVVTTTEELVEGIDSLQLIYGQDQSTDVSSLTGNIGIIATADTLGAAVTNENAWRRVEQVRVGVIASSADVAASAQRTQGSLTALGTTFNAPNDGRYRSSYESVIALRNRLFGN